MPCIKSLKLEARAGIEPAIKDLQSSALPLGDRALLLRNLKLKNPAETQNQACFVAISNIAQTKKNSSRCKLCVLLAGFSFKNYLVAWSSISPRLVRSSTPVMFSKA